MSNFTKHLSDERIIEIVRAADSLHKPLKDRFDGDDAAIVALMTELKVPQTVADKLLITGQVLRECASRGLQIPYPNTLTSNEDDTPSFRM